MRKEKMFKEELITIILGEPQEKARRGFELNRNLQLSLEDILEEEEIKTNPVIKSKLQKILNNVIDSTRKMSGTLDAIKKLKSADASQRLRGLLKLFNMYARKHYSYKMQPKENFNLIHHKMV